MSAVAVYARVNNRLSTRLRSNPGMRRRPLTRPLAWISNANAMKSSTPTTPIRHPFFNGSGAMLESFLGFAGTDGTLNPPFELVSVTILWLPT